MGLLHKKYSSPLSFMGNSVRIGRLSEFVDFVVEQENTDKLWDLYVGSLYTNGNRSFDEFVSSAKTKEDFEMSDEKIKDTIVDSQSIVKQFEGGWTQ